MFSNFPSGFEHGPAVPVLHGGDSDGGGLAGLLASLLESLSRLLEPGSAWNPLAGTMALGSNVHPLIVHFPIAFLSAFLLFEIIGLALKNVLLRQVAGIMLYLGAAGAVAAATAGLIAAEAVLHGAAVHEIMEWHERAGLAVATLAVLLALWRAIAGAPLSAMAQALHLLLAGIVAVCLLLGADLGGLMVYQYGVGVKSLQQVEEHHQHHTLTTDKNTPAP